MSTLVVKRAGAMMTVKDPSVSSAVNVIANIFTLCLKPPGSVRDNNPSNFPWGCIEQESFGFLFQAISEILC